MTSSDKTPEQTLRIIDASLDRVGEGLRLLEDLARFLLNDAVLARQLKTMRHQLVTGTPSFDQRLLQARNARTDVGREIKAGGTVQVRDLKALVVANAKRVQQSLRVVEELAKMPGIELDPKRFKEARFSLYTIERELLAKLLRRDKVERIRGLYVVVDTQALAGRSHLEVAGQAIDGGARVIQLRDKIMSKRGLLTIARQLKELCAEGDALFIVNDHLDLALAADADGLHLGQDDLPVGLARQLLPLDRLLGCSVASVEQAIAAEAEGADYIAAGAIFPTGSKEAIEVIGLGNLRLIRKAVKLPLVAIGGINHQNVAQVVAAGADSVAVISAVLKADSPQEAARKIVDRLEAVK